MIQKFSHFMLLVNDYEEAISWYREKLGFEIKSDFPPENGYRWVTLAPPKQSEIEVAFVLADTEEKRARVGNQTGNHWYFVLATDNFYGDYEAMKAKGVHFLGEPVKQFYGTEILFEDLYGNKIDLLQPS